MELELNILVRLAVALVLAGTIGWERQSANKAAGMRTHMLVGMGAALFSGMTELLVRGMASYGDQLSFDPIRVLEAILTGVGFLGAGVVFISPAEHRVKGLTTAASIWATAAIGTAVGIESYVLAVGATILVFLVLHLLGNHSGRTDATGPTGES